jgi:hypothetical protein
MARGRLALETRHLAPSEVRAVMDLLELLGHDDPSKVAELKVTATPFGLTAEITHVADPQQRLIVPTAAGRPKPQLVLTEG